MKLTTLLLSAATAHALQIPRNQALPNSSLAKRGFSLGLPSNCLQTNGVAFGFLPASGDRDTMYTMAELNSKLALKPACTYGWYSQITSTNYDDSQLTNILSDVKSSGAVFQPAVMPTLDAGFSAINSDVAKQIASSMKKFTDQGIEVWLRFGHEANWYVTDGTYHGTAEEFVVAWKNVWNAVKGNDLVKMYWSPNIASANDLKAWFPGHEYVDVVGVDCYPTGSITSSSFSKCYEDFYNTFSKPYDLPFAIGETAAGPGQKEAWLKELVGQDMSVYSNYVAASWFEFLKEDDFRIVETDDQTLAETKATLSGKATSGGSTSSGGSSSTCDWGCNGWDCSASVPCQSPYTCQSGYCH